MATISNLGSGFHGRMGAVIGYQWRGRWCMRARPAAFHDARTDGQLVQRARFSEVVRMASKMKDVLRIGLRAASQEQHMTESNLFARLNNEAFSMTDGVFETDYSALQLSAGPIAPVAFGAPTTDGSVVVSVPFEKNPDRRTASTEDQVYLVMFCPDLGEVRLSQPAVRRKRCVVGVMESEWMGHEVHLYGFVQHHSGKCSPTCYIGSGIAGEVPEEEPEEADIPAELKEAETTVPKANESKYIGEPQEAAKATSDSGRVPDI